MQLQNIEYLNQFRKEDVVLPREERQYGNVYFSHFRRRRREKVPLEKFLENFITHSELIGALLAEVEREKQEVSRRLADHMKKLLKALPLYSRRAPFMADHFDRLSVEIYHFVELAQVYRDKLQSLLLNRLKTVNAIDRSVSDSYFGGRDIRRLQKVVGKYLDIACYYHDVFSGLLEEALGRTGPNAAMSPAEAALLKLTTLIKTQLFSIEAIAGHLDEWKKRSVALEAQGIYN